MDGISRQVSEVVMVVFGYVNCNMGYTLDVVSEEYADYQLSNSTRDKVWFEGTQEECEKYIEEL